METPVEELLPFQQFAREWKEKVARRARQDLEVAAAFNSLKADFNRVKTVEFSALETKLDESQKIEAKTEEKLQTLQQRHAEELAAIRKRHADELAAIRHEQSKKLAENDKRVRFEKSVLEKMLAKEESKMDAEWARRKSTLKQEREVEDAAASERSLKLLQEEGERLVAYERRISYSTPKHRLEEDDPNSPDPIQDDSTTSTQPGSTSDSKRRRTRWNSDPKASRQRVPTPSPTPISISDGAHPSASSSSSQSLNQGRPSRTEEEELGHPLRRQLGNIPTLSESNSDRRPIKTTFQIISISNNHEDIETSTGRALDRRRKPKILRLNLEKQIFELYDGNVLNPMWNVSPKGIYKGHYCINGESTDMGNATLALYKHGATSPRDGTFVKFVNAEELKDLVTCFLDYWDNDNLIEINKKNPHDS